MFDRKQLINRSKYFNKLIYLTIQVNILVNILKFWNLYIIINNFNLVSLSSLL